MKREHVAFLLGGFAFGILFGFGLSHVVETAPDLAASGVADATVASPQGPMAPTQVGPTAAGGAPMIAEVNRLKRTLQAEPDNFEVIVRLANLYHDAAMWDQAAVYYRRAVELRPDDPDLLTDLGSCLRGQQKYDEALAMFGRANRIDARHWQSLFNMVVVAAFDLEQFDVALRALDSMEAIAPRPAELDPARLRQLRQALERAQGARSPGAAGAS